jgi:hypothetical protein
MTPASYYDGGHLLPRRRTVAPTVVRSSTVAKKGSSSADMEALFGHALVKPKPKAEELKPEARAARTLGVEVLGSVGTSPGLRTWRARTADGESVALVTLAETVTPAERERVGKALGAAQEPIPGMLPVRQVTPEHDAFLTDLWTTGTAKDLSALKWSLRKRLDFVIVVTRSLARLHAAGRTHGCLCADNVLLDDDLRPVLAEAGLVDVRALLARRDALAYEAFAAPELKSGVEPTPRSDQYSVGRLLLAVTAGDESVPASVTGIAHRCVEPPQARYVSTDELVAALEAAASTLPLVEEVRQPEPRKAPPPAERKPRPPPTTPAAKAADRATPPPGATWQLPEPPLWFGLTGLALVAGSLGAGAYAGVANDSLRALLSVLVPFGAALATTLLPPLPQRRTASRIFLGIGLAAVVAVWSPLSLAYRVAAQGHLKGSDEMRRKAVDEIMRLGGDFRGLSLVGINLEQVDLTAANLRGVDMTNANLRGARLTAANLEDTRLDGAALAGADLTLTDLQLASTNLAFCDDQTRFPPGFVCESGHIGRTQTAPP